MSINNRQIETKILDINQKCIDIIEDLNGLKTQKLFDSRMLDTHIAVVNSVSKNAEYLLEILNDYIEHSKQEAEEKDSVTRTHVKSFRDLE